MNINALIFKYLVYLPVVSIRMQNVFYYKRVMERSQFLPKEKLLALQRNRLKRLVTYAARNVPAYDTKAHHRGIFRIEDIENIPFLTKEMIKKDKEQYLTKEIHFLNTNKTTGGSTGQPVTLQKSKDAMARELAATWRGYSWAGIEIGDRQARFWGVPFYSKRELLRTKIIDFVCNRIRCSAFSFTDDDLSGFTKKLKVFRPNYYYGYVSMLREYAHFLSKYDIRLMHRPTAVVTTSELLTKEDRSLFERQFGAKVYDEYGCGEVGSIAHECEAGSMHIMAENMIVEILNGDKPAKNGEIGEIVVTELNNYVMPLIRYRIGDFAAASEVACPCGRTLPVLEKIFGRAYDCVSNRHGRKFHGELFMYIMEEAKRQGLGIGRFQVVQKDFDKFLIRLVPEKGYGTKTKDFITKKVKNEFDPKTQIEYKIVKSIQRERSGKMRLIVGMQGYEN